MDIDDCYKNLANAIVIRAADDYLNAKKDYKKDHTDYKARGQITSIRKFFRSNWFGKLTTVDPEYLIDKLDKEADHDQNRMVQQSDISKR